MIPTTFPPKSIRHDVRAYVLFRLLPVAACFFLAGCIGPPEGVAPIRNFSLPDYMGKWYEIARLDHSFERGLTHVSAIYTLQEDGTVHVLNQGYDPDENAWKRIEGRALPVQDPDVGSLKVSFFGPFWAGYHIIDMAEDGKSVLVSGYSRDYLWILSRTPRLDEAALRRFVETARALGFPTDQLLFVDQSSPLPSPPATPRPSP